MSADNQLTRSQCDDLRAIAAMIVPASDEYKVPGADDPAIQADMLATLGRDAPSGGGGARSSGAARGPTVRRARCGQARCGGAGVSQFRRRGCRDARPRGAAMLLPR